MKLSIITVNLNNRIGLKRTIDSVISQTFTDYEWIVIDGGSTDGSRELIEQYKDHFAYWCSEFDKGIYNAMNKGIAHSKGEWLQFLNSGDCLYESTTLKKVFATDYSADIIYGNDIINYNRKDEIRVYPNKLSLSYLVNHPINHQASFYRRSLFEQESFNEAYLIISDYVFLLNSAISGKSFQYVNLIITHSEGGGISQKGIDEAKKVKNIIPELIQRDLDFIYQKEYQDAYIANHKSLKFLSKIIGIAEKTIRFIELKKKKLMILPRKYSNI